MAQLMFWSLTVAVLQNLTPGLALPLEDRSKYALHEKRDLSRTGAWRPSTRVASDAIVPLRIGLVQTNLEHGYDRLQAVSDPASPSFGKHLSADEVHDLFSPSSEAITQVREWLIVSGIDESNIVHSDNKGWFALEIEAAHVERLFRTEIREYEHDDSGHLRLGCDEYHVPAHLTDHIDYITPGVKLSHSLRKRGGDGWPGWPHHPHGPHGPHRHPIPHHHGPPHLPPAAHGLPPDLQHCNVNITPVCYRALYGIPLGKVNDPANSPGFFEQGDYYSQADLDLQFKYYATRVPVGTEPIRKLIDGAEVPVPADSPLNTGESDIDLQIAMPLIYPTIPTVYQVDDQNYAPKEVARDNLFNTFLDAIDGSYCNYTAYGITGDSWKDPKYPDPAPNGYKGQRQCGVYQPTRVISASYGEAEADIPILYNKRQCNEWMKLALQGITVLFSSGDFGVGSAPGNGAKNGCYKSHPKVFNPLYVSGCPWVTSVGATALYAGQTVLDAESAMKVDLGPGAHNFATSGGFSNYFPRAWYQEAAVSEWFQNHDPGYPTYVANADASNVGEGGGIYNSAGRAYPDVSANGAYMVQYTNRTVYHSFGASLSAPIWASVITLINIERSAAGKGPVGFLNPTLYANPWVLNDIKNGSNPNCGSAGFSAVEGWDPITGLGTPNYPKLLELFMGLP